MYELFHTRSSMHQRVYTHRKAKAIEYMIVDALIEVGPGGICFFFFPNSLFLIPQIQPVVLGLCPIMPTYAD